jgi:hypothetical protein
LFVDSQPIIVEPESVTVPSGKGSDLVCERGIIGPGADGLSPFKEDFIDWFTFESSPGAHTFSLRYRAKCLIGSHGCPEEDQSFYRNRKLWVIPIG